MAVILFVLAAILAGVDVFRSDFRSATAWSALILSVALILVSFGVIGMNLSLK